METPYKTADIGFKIEKNIPLPGKCAARKTEIQLAMEKMEVGDSILLGKKWFGGVYNAIEKLRKENKTFALRMISPDSKRLWRTK